MRARPAWVVAGLLAVALAACGEAPPTPTSGYEPASLAGPEDAEIREVTLTDEGARRIGLRTAEVRAAGTRTLVPADAVIYGSSGTTSVYVNPGGLRFLRQEIDIESAAGASVVVLGGPPAGTRVLTVGAAEVYGTEFEVGH